MEDCFTLVSFLLFLFFRLITFPSRAFTLRAASRPLFLRPVYTPTQVRPQKRPDAPNSERSPYLPQISQQQNSSASGGPSNSFLEECSTMQTRMSHVKGLERSEHCFFAVTPAQAGDGSSLHPRGQSEGKWHTALGCVHTGNFCVAINCNLKFANSRHHTCRYNSSRLQKHRIEQAFELNVSHRYSRLKIQPLFHPMHLHIRTV